MVGVAPQPREKTMENELIIIIGNIAAFGIVMAAVIRGMY